MSKRTIGLDIGSSSLRAVELSHSPKGIIVHRAEEIKIPRNVVSGSDVLNREIFQSSLKTLWKQGNFKSKKVRVGISSSNILARTLVKDWLKDSDLSRVLPNVVKDDLPAAANEYYLDFFSVEDIEKEKTKKKKIFLAGAPRKLVDELVYSIQSAGLDPISIDMTGLSLIRTLPDASNTKGININVDIGAMNTTFAISRQGKPLYLRVLSNVGGYNIDDDIINALNIKSSDKFELAQSKKISILEKSAEVAEARAKKTESSSVFGPDSNSPEIRVTEEMIAISRSLTTSMVTIVSKIRDAWDEFVYNNPNVKINSFVLSGGLAGTPNITSRLSSEFQTIVTLNNPSDEITNSYLFASAYGLALGTGASHE